VSSRTGNPQPEHRENPVLTLNDAAMLILNVRQHGAALEDRTHNLPIICSGRRRNGSSVRAD